MRKITLYSFIAAVLLISLFVFPGRAWAQSGTVTGDGFLSSNSTTQSVNLNGQGIALIVAGSAAAVGSVHVGTTKTYIKFQLDSSLPPAVAATNIAKATLKLFISPSCSPGGAIDIYPVNSAWTESTLTTSLPAVSSTAFATGITVGKANSFLVVDVTQLVQEWLNGSANGGLDNNGIALVASTSATYAVFDSKESIVTSHEPRLEIVLVNSGTQGPAGATGAQGPKGDTGSAGSPGAPGAAASVQVGTTMTVPAGTPASVLNGGTSSEAVLNFLIPQGPTGLTGPGGNQGPQGQQGPMGLPGLPGPPGPMPAGAALTTTPNTFNGNQTINGSLMLGAGGGIQFADGSVQTSALSSGGGAGATAGSLMIGASPVAPPGFSLYGTLNADIPWARVADMPTARTGLAAVTVNGMIYAIGGLTHIPWDAAPTALSTVEVYNPATNTWTTSNNHSVDPTAPAPMPTARGNLAAATVNGKIYVIGGSSDGSPVSMNTLEVYDPGTNTWSAGAAMPSLKQSLGAATVNGKIYAIAGRLTYFYDSCSNCWSSGPNETVDVYDPGTNTWSTAAPVSTTREGLAAATLNGKIYAIGGFGGNSGPYGSNTYLGTVEVYDPATDTWSAAADVPLPTGGDGLAAATVSGKIYAMGGHYVGYVNSNPYHYALRTVEVYDPRTDTWSAGKPMQFARWGLAASDANGFIYAIGGGDSPYFDDVRIADRSYVEQSPPVTLYVYIKN